MVYFGRQILNGRYANVRLFLSLSRVFLRKNSKCNSKCKNCTLGFSPNKYRTSTEQVNCAENENVMLVVRCLGRNQLSQKELMGKVGLRHRPTFIENYISPSINSSYVRLLYPDSPRHPRQKYLLTVKGLGLYNELTK